MKDVIVVIGAGSDRAGDRAAGQRRQACPAGRPATRERGGGGRGAGRCRLRRRAPPRSMCPRGTSVHALVEKARLLGDVTGLIHAAGVSPSQASPETILQGRSVRHSARARGVRRRHRRGRLRRRDRVAVRASLPPLSVEQRSRRWPRRPARSCSHLPLLQPDQVKDSLHAYQMSKRGNSLRVMAEAVRWGRRGARINTISPGIIITPLANDELQRASRRRLPAHDRAVAPPGAPARPTKSAPSARCDGPRWRRSSPAATS